jgi:putative methyltransferase (TIGR04325 family)
MRQKMRIKDLVPPIIPKMISSIRPQKYGWFGEYKSWQEALNDSTGYAAEAIASKVKDALLQVRAGKAVYERDSVLFEKIEYSWHLLAGLMWIAAQEGGRLSVLDFGGSLGSTYFQNLKFLSTLKNLRWNVVEQDIFVKSGKAHFEDHALHFHSEFEHCYRDENPNVTLFSSVLQYLESPYEMLNSHFAQAPAFIIVDNMPFIGTSEKITVQKVPPHIYDASYPCWLLNRKKFLDFFDPFYEMVADFKSGLAIRVGTEIIPYEGFIFRIRKNGLS